jgi:hypothetical protein
MTKNRARKQDARKRAALTGEPYVVAQRAVAQRQPQKSSRIHTLTHKIAGVPAHVGGGLQGVTRSRASNPTTRHQHQHGEPRVLVAWQNWIARRLRSQA